MPANKNALIRYKTIDNCLRNKYRWTLNDLVDACSDALYDMEGITKGVSVRTVQADLQIMRSDKLAITLLSRYMTISIIGIQTQIIPFSTCLCRKMTMR